MGEQKIYYHFVQANKHLQYDLEDTEVSVGLTLRTNKEIELCEYGFHASAKALDALKYAPLDSQWLCGVTLSGVVKHGDDKSVASERTVIWMINVRKLLVEFACWCAEQAFEEVRKLGIEPDERSLEALRVTRLWLVDQATEEEVNTAARAARAADAADVADAARAAARAADAVADAVVYAAAYAADAARAARAAAYAADAARAAAYAADAARAAARAADAARAAARAAQNEKLKQLIAEALQAQTVAGE